MSLINMEGRRHVIFYNIQFLGVFASNSLMLQVVLVEKSDKMSVLRDYTLISDIDLH